jgi:hypothetical protein
MTPLVLREIGDRDIRIGVTIRRSGCLAARGAGRVPSVSVRPLAARVVEHLEQSGFEIDEAEQVMRKRPPSANHG